MSDFSTGEIVQDLHRDLVGKYNKHAGTIKQYWLSFDQKQRTQCIKAGSAEGLVLKHSFDRSLGNVYKFIPEINLRDLTHQHSDSLLELLKHRATTTILDQYMIGLDSGPGDHCFMKQMMETRNLRLKNRKKNQYMVFLNEDRYGKSMEIICDESEVMAELAPAIEATYCVSQELGELILQRQLYVLQILNLVVEAILDIGSTTRYRTESSKKSNKTAAAITSKLSTLAPPQSAKSLSLSDLIHDAGDQKATFEDYLALLSTEPVVLTHAVNHCFFSRPELLPDEKGRTLPVHTDKYISGVILEAVFNAVKAAAIWNYLGRLLNLLSSETAADKSYKAIVLQEISNVSQLEYSPTHGHFKRHTQFTAGTRWFKRLSNVSSKTGVARIAMKHDPDTLIRTNPQLRYVLHLWKLETYTSKANDWMFKLNNLYNSSPSKRDKPDGMEAGPLNYLAIIVSFIQDLTALMPMPPVSRKKTRLFIARSEQLDVEMNHLKSKIDLLNYVVPIDNLLEPGVVSKALDHLDQFIIENTGTKIGFIFKI